EHEVDDRLRRHPEEFEGDPDPEGTRQGILRALGGKREDPLEGAPDFTNPKLVALAVQFEPPPEEWLRLHEAEWRRDRADWGLLFPGARNLDTPVAWYKSFRMADWVYEADYFLIPRWERVPTATPGENRVKLHLVRYDHYGD